MTRQLDNSSPYTIADLDPQHISFITSCILRNDKDEIIFISKDVENKYEKLFNVLFSEKTKAFRIPKELFNSKMKLWINQCLSKIPYSNIFNNPNGHTEQELETYNELCNLKPEEMEWGVVQKAISLLLSINPENFGIDEVLKVELNCIHTEKTIDQLRIGSCPRCHGNGFLQGSRELFGDEELRLKTYNQIVNNCKKIQHYILEKIQDIKEEIIVDIWFNIMNDRDRYNADGEIVRLVNKSKAPNKQLTR